MWQHGFKGNSWEQLGNFLLVFVTNVIDKKLELFQDMQWSGIEPTAAWKQNVMVIEADSWRCGTNFG